MKSQNGSRCGLYLDGIELFLGGRIGKCVSIVKVRRGLRFGELELGFFEKRLETNLKGQPSECYGPYHHYSGSNRIIHLPALSAAYPSLCVVYATLVLVTGRLYK